MINKNLNPKLFDEDIEQIWYQKTDLSIGFNAAVDGKLSSAPQVVAKYYHIITLLSKQKCLRVPDGIRTRTYYLRGSESTINLPAQFTEAGGLLQMTRSKVN